jgi:two-component system, LytTR family, response regulator
MLNPIPIVIVDDEPGSIITLETLLREYCPEVHVAGSAANAEEAKALIEKYRPALVFLDIEMPFANGFDLLDQMNPVNFDVIFVTAFNNYALKAFKYAALDYLLKPVNIEELKESVKRAIRVLPQTGQQNKRVEALLDNIEFSSEHPVKITVPTGNTYEVVPLETILYIEASGNFSILVFEKGNRLMASRRLKEFEEVLPETMFVRVHHSYIINLSKIRKYQKGRSGVIELVNGEKVEVSARKKNELLARIKKS